MKKADILFYAERKGLCVYEHYEGRKVFYKVRIPTFTEGKVVPTGYKDMMVRNLKEVKEKVDELWSDDKYRGNAAAWVRTW